MNNSLGLLPSGKIRYFSGSDTGKSGPALANITKHFVEKCTNVGLFALAALKSGSSLPPTFRFWYEFACQYMTTRCHSPDGETLSPIEPLDTTTAEHFLHSAPPMIGAEYLSVAVLQQLWVELDNWLIHEVAQHYDCLATLLKTRAPHWHQVGRVCFHLAENKTDPDYPFAFMATYSPSYGQGKSRHLPLAKALEEYAGSKNKARLIHLLSPIDLAAKSSALVKNLVDSGDIYHPLAWSPQEAYQFLKEVPLFEESGIIIRLPDWWKKRPRPKVKATLSTGLNNTFNADAMLRFNVQVALGDNKLTQTEWDTLLAADDGLAFIKGQWVEVDKEKLEQAMAQMKALEKHGEEEGISFIEGMRLLSGASSDLSTSTVEQDATEWAFIEADSKLSKILQQIRQPETLKSALPKRALKATLRPYQETGVNWLWHLNQLGLGACLADDMGLGKTIQIISLLLILKKNKVNRPSLLVLPTSLMGNWKSELEKFAPSLKALFVHPSLTSKTQLDELSKAKQLSGVDVVITTYGMLLRQIWLQNIQWHMVVLDEAQAIKNPGTQQSKMAKKIRAHARIALTGTPVENRLADLWSLFDFICPGLLGTATRFKSFTKSLEKRESEQYAPLRNLVQPYILRRLKTDKSIISDLPDKTEVYAYCGLSKAQASLYQKSVNELATSLRSADGMKRRGLVLSFILRFKQICNHPAQFMSDGDYRAQRSGKFLRLAEICDEISSRQEKVLVFTQFREMCEPLADFLSDCFGQPGLVLHGAVSAKKRQEMVEQFQAEDGPPFFVLSIKAGGTGLTLTEASHVIHFDRWWNPAVENQATDRAFRIGQKNNVLVHKFVCQGTIEEKIDAIIAEKSALANDILEGGSEVMLTEMSDSELIELVSLDLERTQV
ncbi:DEAD/DEAH box helicase [Endozoicomonas sp. SM1973]|uniref:DEAD/DEAH box helicase n=1 Tax=Spartinivicinus marinus TaxID=2994442 RepID=A0A853IC07_9GAMM|nr:DEAD/DEAH box helicase [Spartinivicinus marinus]MCX4026910.1 DEAD/DEAH box helicase [Spartinivicinus marinus]NYZ66745.1 DEAD/DEAH box helicase [Spartinivicinus marinus]